MAVRHINHSETVLKSPQERGFNTSTRRIKWKAPGECRSIKYNQSGFDVNSDTGRSGHAIVNFSKICDFHLDSHRPLTDDANINEVIKKTEARRLDNQHCHRVQCRVPRPAVEDINVEDTVGIDLGITKFVHDSEDRTFARLDEHTDRERIERRHRSFSREQHDSENWDKARQSLARAYERLNNRREDYREKLAHWYTEEYDAVCLEYLDVADDAPRQEQAEHRCNVMVPDNQSVRTTRHKKRMLRCSR
jgi:Transposase and inactivated derivatives